MVLSRGDTLSHLVLLHLRLIVARRPCIVVILVNIIIILSSSLLLLLLCIVVVFRPSTSVVAHDDPLLLSLLLVPDSPCGDPHTLESSEESEENSGLRRAEVQPRGVSVQAGASYRRVSARGEREYKR
jgi:hypothetical protein